MRTLLLFFFLLLLFVPVTGANATALDEIVARLDALERENAALRQRVSELEQTASTAVTASTADAAAATALAYASAPQPGGSGADLAFAAETPSRDRWDRTYIGLQGGYALGEPEYPFLGDAFDGDTFAGEMEGASYGVQAGQTWQQGWFVAGVDFQLRKENISAEAEARSEYSFIENDDHFEYLGVGIASTDVSWSAAAKGRLGLATNRTLLYATGGVTAAQVDESYESITLETVNATGPGGSGDGATRLIDGAFEESSSIQMGLIAGLGFEYALTENLSVGAEYEYSWLGERSFAPTGSDTRLDWHSLSARFNVAF